MKASILFFVFASVLFNGKRLLRYLRFLQQDAYSIKRFLGWFWKHKAFDRRGTLTAIGTFIAASYLSYAFLFIGALALLGWFFAENDPRKEGKLKLKMTPRAKRIFALALTLYSIFQIIVLMFNPRAYLVAQIILFQLTPLWLLLSVAILSFDEKRRQRQFACEARDKLKEVSPFVIGITGSYGKTSTKDALGNILQVTLGATFWPSKGINTDMGITRDIRNRLEKGISYAVIEMGAYGKGSIARLCGLTPPNAGIITTIGVAHLDRFKNQETIRKAKAELAQAIPAEGILVCNGDNEGTRRIAKENPKKTTLLYGFENGTKDLACWISDYKVTGKGTAFTFQWKGAAYSGETALVGKPALSNLAAAFAMACALGADPEYVLGAIAGLKPVENRLEVCKEQDVIYLRDAYNSNPDGFEAALDALSACEAGQKILMTPGMVELSSLEKVLHEKIGKKAAEVCDKVIIVGPTNRINLTRGLISGGMSKEQIFYTPHRDEAFKTLKNIVTPGDAVLIENDLPDLYERKESF